MTAGGLRWRREGLHGGVAINFAESGSDFLIAKPTSQLLALFVHKGAQTFVELDDLIQGAAGDGEVGSAGGGRRAPSSIRVV